MTRRQIIQSTAALGAAGTGSQLSASSGANIYTRIGVQPFINLTATYTINGGTLTLPEVKQAMDEASRHAVNIDELMEKVSERLAALLGCELGIVTSGCAAALTHTTAACVTGGDPEKISRLPNLAGLKNEVVTPRQSRHIYDHAIRMVGVRLVVVDTREEFHAALNDRTALVAVLGTGEAAGSVRLEEMVAAAHKRGIPVLVDAAAELPLRPNPYLSRGADLVAYSGGKILRGPQCAGLLLGRRDLVRAAWYCCSPHHGFGRPMKVGKEEIMGMLAAVEAWVHQRDIQAECRTWEGWLGDIAAEIRQVKGVEARILPPAGASPFPVLTVSWDPAEIPLTAGELGRRLLEGPPRIMSHAEGQGHSFVLRPASIQPGQHTQVAARLAALFREAQAAPRRTRPPAPAAMDLTGEWLVTVRFQAGQAEHRLALRADKNRLLGRHHTLWLSGELQGSVEGDRVDFASSIPCEALLLSYHFTGKLAGGGMSGDLDLGEYGKASWSARRA